MSFLPSFVQLDPVQRQFLEFKPEASIVVDGIPNSGKTTLAFYTIKRLRKEGYSCIYLAPSSLFLKYAARLGAELGIEDFHCDTLFHYLNKGSRQYDYVVLDDSHIYSLSHLILLQQKGRFFYLFGNYSHPLLDTYYLGDDRLSDQELPPLEGVRTLFGAKVFQLSPSLVPQAFVKLLNWYRSKPFDPSLSKLDGRVRVLKMDSLEEQCAYVKRFVEGTGAASVCVAAFTRKTVMDALDSFSAMGLGVQAYLPGRDGVDTLDFGSNKPVLTTIKSMTGLHFDDVFILSFDRKEIWINGHDAFEIAVTRANNSLTFFYTQELAQPLASLPKSFYEDNITKGVDLF